MTCREKLAKEHPDRINSCHYGGCYGCPYDYGYLDRPEFCKSDCDTIPINCTKCWNREIPGTEETKEKEMDYTNHFMSMSKEELIDIIHKIDRIRDCDKRISVMETDIKRKDEELDRLIKHTANKDERISAMEKQIEDLEKDVNFYRNEMYKRDQRIDEKEAKILNMQDTIDFQERHILRIENELKLYKGMHVDTNKTDYNKCTIEPICKSVPSSAVIGKIEEYKYDWNRETEQVTFSVPKDSVKKITGKDNWRDIEYLIIPSIEDSTEQMKKCREGIYYTRYLGKPCLNSTPNTSNSIPPVAKDYDEIAKHTFRKFTALKKAGFTEDQAIQLTPIWLDEEEK